MTPAPRASTIVPGPGGQDQLSVIERRYNVKAEELDQLTWSPNGRVLIFFRQTRTTTSGGGGVTKVYSVDLTGYNLRQVKTPTDASDPAWSPLIN